MTNEPRNILIIDSSAIIHRSYHGYPEIFSNYRGNDININVLKGYANYVYKLSREFEFDECIHVLDPEGGSAYRKKIYPEYKAGRPPENEDLTIQKKMMVEFLNAFQQKNICIPGVESDDVLAKIARIEAEKGNKVLVLSPDKDILQIVEDFKISVGRLTKNKDRINVHDIYEELGVHKKFGVHPYQIPDLLALISDISDNIIGVPGVGEKTAIKLIAAYNDIETMIMKSADIIESHEKGIKTKEVMSYKIALNFQSVAEKLPLMKRLTTALDNFEVPNIEEISTSFDEELYQTYFKLLNCPEHWNEKLGQ